MVAVLLLAGSQPGGADYGAFSGAMMQPSQQLQQHPSLAAGTAAASALAPTPEASAAAAAAMEAVNAAAAAAAGMTEVAAPSMVAAAAAAGMESNGGAASLQPVQPAKTEQLTYAAIREAAAVNQAADGAADDAMRAVAAAQQTLQLLMNPPQAAAGAQASTAMEDDAGNSTHHPSGRARRTRTSTGYMDGGVMGVGIYGGGRPNKGLRHFSMKVCEKVESKGTTSYNEVADELVAELKDGNMDDGICYDEKNIRRRVYDAINVLMALDIIAKEKKAIIWRGFPTTRSAAQQVRQQYGSCGFLVCKVASFGSHQCRQSSACSQTKRSSCVMSTALELHQATLSSSMHNSIFALQCPSCPPCSVQLT